MLPGHDFSEIPGRVYDKINDESLFILPFWIPIAGSVLK